MEKIHIRSSLAALAGAVLAYCVAPWFGFVFDDRKQILANPSLLHPASIPGYFTHAGGYLAGDLSYYRPIFGAWMNLNYFLFGLHPAGWHITLILLHVVAVFLCYRMVAAITEDKSVAAIASLLFAVHPAHVESVAWVSGGTDPLAAVFILAAFLLYLAGQENWKTGILGWLAFAASLLCKEATLLFPFVILAHGILLGDRSRKAAAILKSAVPYFVIAAVYLAVRIHVMGAFSHTLTQLSPASLLLTLPSVVLFYVRILIFPTGLSPFYDTPYVRTASFSGFVIPLLVLIAIAGLLVLWIRSLRKPSAADQRGARQVVFFVLWAILFLVPALNLSALDPGEIAHDRYLYLPSIGICALIGMALKQLVEKLQFSQSIRIAGIAGLAVILCSATIAQSIYWRDDQTLYKRGASMAPNNINAQNNLANIYLEAGDFEQGIAVHQRILKLNPQFVNSYFNLGLAYYRLGDLAQAESYLERAVSLRPSGDAYLYLGLAQFKKGELTRAETSLQTATQLDQTRADFHAALGVLYETEGRLPSALEELERALSLNPQNIGVRNEIAKIQKQMGLTQP